MDWVKRLEGLYTVEPMICDCCDCCAPCYDYMSNFYGGWVWYCLECMLQDINDWLAQSCDVVM